MNESYVIIGIAMGIGGFGLGFYLAWLIGKEKNGTLQAHYDSTKGLWCADKEPSELSKAYYSDKIFDLEEYLKSIMFQL